MDIGKNLHSVDDGRSIMSQGGYSMRSHRESVKDDAGNTLIGPQPTLRDEAKKIAGTMKGVNWDYKHSRGGQNAPGTGLTSAEKIGRNN